MVQQKALNCGIQTLNRLIDRHLVPLLGKLNGGNETWLYVLRTLAKIKRCSSCKEVYSHSLFGKDSHTSDGLAYECSSCKKTINEVWYSNNKEYHRKYLEDHRAAYNARNAKRRAAKVQATPSWSDLKRIESVYAQCREGYHVDHIYPLISDWVCGLHVPENLQIIPMKDNLSKSNRYIEELHG